MDTFLMSRDPFTLQVAAGGGYTGYIGYMDTLLMFRDPSNVQVSGARGYM